METLCETLSAPAGLRLTADPSQRWDSIRVLQLLRDYNVADFGGLTTQMLAGKSVTVYALDRVTFAQRLKSLGVKVELL